METKKANLFYVEDDESLGFVTRDNLELNGYSITHCLDGLQAVQVAKEQHFDLCLLDVMLPEMDGFSVATEIRKRDSHIPILFLTAKSLKEDRIHGLRLGADDYITKPFSIEELILKIEVFLRRSQTNGRSFAPLLQIGTFELDYPNLTLTNGTDSRKLTQRETDLLKLLIENKNQAAVYIFVADQSPASTKQAIWQTFLHQETPFINGVEKIAARTNYPVFYFAIKKRKTGHYVVTFSRLEPTVHSSQKGNLTEAYASELERQITKTPYQWLWSHNRWKRAKTGDK